MMSAHRSLGERFRQPQKPGSTRTFVALTAVLALSGCNASHTPTFAWDESSATHEKSQATINDVVDHVACELWTGLNHHLGAAPAKTTESATQYRALVEGALADRLAAKITAPNGKSDDFGLWSHLIGANFVVTVNMSLQVTNSEGFNPSFNFIDPYNTLTTSSGMFNGSLALAVAGQLDGTQNRTFTLSYLIDLSKLWGTKLEGCSGPSKEHDIHGNLGLEEIFADGLTAIDKTRSYNIYSTPDPDEAAPQPQAQLAPSAVRPDLALAGVGAAGGSAGKTNTVSFGSEIDFTVVQAVNGGPTLTLRHFTGPGGGGGGGGKGGGGGGGSGGSGGGSSGGGGANQGLIAFNRTAVDSISIQAGATCVQKAGTKDDYWSAIPECKDGNGGNAVLQLQNELNINRLKQAFTQ